MKYLVYDTETNTEEKYGRKAHYKYNDIVAIGLKYQGEKEAKTYYGSPDDHLLREVLQNVDILIGHNIKFDNLYLWKFEAFQNWLKRGGKIWDTQLAEYMLTGQRHKYPALREVAVQKYGCGERTKYMEKYWDKGVNTCDIPKELVLEDVKQDVLDTEQVMLGQVKEAKSKGMYKLIFEVMEGLLATTEMEYNGMYINQQIKERNQKDLEGQIEEKTRECKELCMRYWK